MKIYAPLCLSLAFATSTVAFAQLSVSDSDHYSIWHVAEKNYDVKSAKLSTGVTLQYVEQGNADGIPVLFLHGITDSWHSYESLLPELPAYMHAFAISQRGHGDSERPAGGYAMKDFSADIEAFIRELKLGPVVVVGHSMSGLIVQQFALDYPQLVKGIVIIASAPSFHDNPGMPEFVQLVKQLSDPIDPAFADEFQKSTLAKPIDPAYYSIIVQEGLKVPARVWKAAFEGIMEVDYTSRLKHIHVPTLIVWGEKDNFCTKDNQDAFVRGIRQTRFIIYPDTGHALHWEAPRQFAADLTDFVRKLIYSPGIKM